MNLKLISINTLFFITRSFLIPADLLAANKLLHYEPEIVELIGTIRKITFPGPPNYYSIADGDAIEAGAYLKLDLPIDVDLLPNDSMPDINEPEKNIKIVQIVDSNTDHWKKFKEGNHLKITGTLFHRFTGHHHASVLIMVEKVKNYSKDVKSNT